MEIKISPDEAVILCMKYFMKDKYSLKDISKFLNISLKTVQLAEAKVKTKVGEAMSIRLKNYRIYAKRNQIAEMVKKGEISTREFERMGFKGEDLHEEAIILGIGEEDEHYEKRFISPCRRSPKNSCGKSS